MLKLSKLFERLFETSEDRRERRRHELAECNRLRLRYLERARQKERYARLRFPKSNPDDDIGDTDLQKAERYKCRALRLGRKLEMEDGEALEFKLLHLVAHAA